MSNSVLGLILEILGAVTPILLLWIRRGHKAQLDTLVTQGNGHAEAATKLIAALQQEIKDLRSALSPAEKDAVPTAESAPTPHAVSTQ